MHVPTIMILIPTLKQHSIFLPVVRYNYCLLFRDLLKKFQKDAVQKLYKLLKMRVYRSFIKYFGVINGKNYN